MVHLVLDLIPETVLLKSVYTVSSVLTQSRAEREAQIMI